METSDDAGVYLLREGLALVQTVDFLTPVVDDPYTYGRIAVCNGLSDVYAMGGTPITALNIICFPTGKFSMGVLKRILEGGVSMLEEAGVDLLGGHSVEDEEMKYGVAVTGTADPARIWRNTGLMPGDAIVLTKPLGTGIVSTAVKAGIASEESMRPYVKAMTTLNGIAASEAARFDVHACTDVTGFGLMGHMSEMLGSNPFEIAVDASSLPLLPGAVDHAAMGIIPAGMYRNRDYVGGRCVVERGVPLAIADIAFDPQTSGGLLVALPEAQARSLADRLIALGHEGASIIARVKQAGSPVMRIV